jgi:hypothetical protein
VLHCSELRRYFTAVAVAVAVATITGCEGGAVMTEAASRDVRRELRRSPRAIASGQGRDEHARGADREERASADGASSHGSDDAAEGRRDEPASDAGQSATIATGDAPAGGEHLALDLGDADPQLYAIVRTEGIDLEFTEGLREPPQSSIVPPPAPWSPDPASAEAPQPVIDDVWPTKAPAAGGEKVVIRGKNLHAAQILFGLAPARIIRESEESVTVEAPPSSGEKVGIVVTNRDGHYAVAGTSFEYYN